MANEVLRDSHGLTAREATIVADDILLLLAENFDAGVEELEKASPLTWPKRKSSFAGRNKLLNKIKNWADHYRARAWTQVTRAYSNDSGPDQSVHRMDSRGA
jgi:hypothetical protein